MNVFLKYWRRLKLAVYKRLDSAHLKGRSNKFRIGDFVCETGKAEAGEVVDAFYGFDMRGHSWHYKVEYGRIEKVVVLYRESEICIDAAWIRERRLEKLGI